MARPEPVVPPVLDLRDCIQVFDEALEPALCRQMIDSFHRLERFQRANGRGIRPGLEHSGWTELNLTPLSDAGFRGFIQMSMQRYLQRYNERLRLSIPVPGSEQISELVIKRYTPEDAGFQPHFDALGPKANRYLVFLWYLNDVAEGGETTFVDLGIDVAPRAGRLLMFPPAWMFQHEGRRPRSGDKYILSTYLLF